MHAASKHDYLVSYADRKEPRWTPLWKMDSGALNARAWEVQRARTRVLSGCWPSAGTRRGTLLSGLRIDSAGAIGRGHRAEA